MIKLDMTLVSGSSSNHFYPLLQWLDSVYTTHIPERVVVWDLGMKQKQLKELHSTWGEKIILRTFDYSKYPSWFDITKNRGEYAWKPSLIKETFDMFKDKHIFWMDAGCVVTGDLNAVKDVIESVGIYASNASGTLVGYTDVQTMDYLNIAEQDRPRRMKAATAVGFNVQNKNAIGLLNEWARLARKKECIAPEGSHRDADFPHKHRQDQSVLTCLFILRGYYDLLPARALNYLIHQDNKAKQGKNK